MAEGDAPEDLLARCEEARRAGSDFPTIWLSILKSHPLVTGLPRHLVRDGKAIIVVKLLNRYDLLSAPDRFWLE